MESAPLTVDIAIGPTTLNSRRAELECAKTGGMLTERHKKLAARPPQLKSFKSDLKNEVALIEREYLAPSTTLPPSKKRELLDALFNFKRIHADLLGCSAERPVFQKSASFNNRSSRDRNEDVTKASRPRSSRSFNTKQPLAHSIESPKRDAKSPGLGLIPSDRDRNKKSGPPPPPPPRPPYKCGEDDALTHENPDHKDKANDIVPPVDVSFSRETKKLNYRSRAQDYLDLQCYR